MVPWLALPPCTLFAKFLTDRLVAREWSLTNVRKVIQSCCFLGQNLALFCMCHTNNFSTALFCMTVIIGRFLLSLAKIFKTKKKQILPRWNWFSQQRCHCQSTRLSSVVFRKRFRFNEHSRSYTWIPRCLLGWTYLRIDTKLAGCIHYSCRNKYSGLDCVHHFWISRSDSVV